MITEAIVIGAVEAAIFWEEDDKPHAVRLDPTWERLIDCSRDVGWLLSIGAEKRRLRRVPRDIEGLRAELRAWSEGHRALTMMISGMDAHLTESTRASCIRVAEESLRRPTGAAFARARLLGCPLPGEAELDSALRLAFETGALGAAALYGSLRKVAPYTWAVRQALERLVRHKFDDDIDPDSCLRAIVDSGMVADALEAAGRRDRASLNGLVFRYANHPEVAEVLPRPAHFLTNFVAATKNAVEWEELKPAAVLAEPFEFQDTRDDSLVEMIHEWKRAELASRSRQRRPQPRTSRSVDDPLTQIEQQKEFIVQNLRANRIGRAENAIRALVRRQRRDSTLAQLCMSLCDLGAIATRLHLFDVARSLYEAAKVANERDLVPVNGYAETLRQMGRLDEALAAYGDARAAFPHEVVPVNGYAETLRQMGRLDEAESEVRVALTRFPNERVAKNALACLLIDARETSKARALLAAADPKTEQDWRDYHVAAMASIKDGNNEEAEKLLSYGTQSVPFQGAKEVFRTSLAYVKLLRRQYQEASSLIESDEVLKFRPAAVAIIDAHANAALGRLDRAEKSLLDAERSRSDKVVHLADFLRKRYAMGAYAGQVPDGREASLLDQTIAEAEFDLALRIARIAA